MPSVGTTPYDTAGYVLNLTRARLNDARSSISGELLTNTAPYTFVYLNAAFRKVQRKLNNLNYETYVAEAIVENLPAVATVDPTVQVNLNFTAFNNGTANTTQVLPADMVGPLLLYERQNGSGSRFIPMSAAQDGLPSRNQGSYQRLWEWRSDAIWMPGATVAIDLKIRYNKWILDLADEDSPVPIIDIAGALSFYTAAEFVAARGGDVAAFVTQGEAELKELSTRNSRRAQRFNIRRRPYSRSNMPGWDAY